MRNTHVQPEYRLKTSSRQAGRGALSSHRGEAKKRKLSCGARASWGRMALVGGLVTLPLMAGASAHAVVNNTGSTDSISLSIEMQCSFMTKGAASAADGSYRATGANGTDATFADGNNTRTFNIACNQISGYTVRGYTTDLAKDGGSDTMAFVNYADYANTKNSTPGVGIWSAELVDADAGATFGTAATPNILKHTTEASNVNGDEFSVNYMAYIGRTTPSGTYTGEAVYQLAMNPLVTDYDWSVTYSSGTAGTNATGMPTDQSGENVDLGDTVPVTLGAAPTWQYHTFAGWKDQNDGIHAAGSTIEVSETSNIWTMTAQWDEVAVDYSVAFNANLPSGVASLTSGSIPDTLSDTVNMSIAQSKTFDLTSTSEPAIDGYTFLGWSESSSATSASYTKDGRNGTATSITLQSATPSTTLYAIWHKDVVTLANGANMQDLTAASCAAIPKYSVSGTTYELVDSRDNHSYLVRKLEDGNCWMVQNLSLYAKTTITADDTDLNGTDAENNAFISNWNNATSVTAGSSKWTNDATKYQVYNGTYQANTKNTTVSSDNTPTSNTGSYYPFIVATAGYNITASTDGQQAGNSSICPKGWKLPTGGPSGQFNTLYTTGYSSNSGNFQSAMNIDSAYPGLCYSGRCPNARSNIYLWSSTIQSGTYGYFLDAYSGYVNPTSNGYKYYGLSVRCVLLGS